MEIIIVLASLFFFHFLFDYPLQGDYMARAKNPVDPVNHVPWTHVMSAHAFLHAGGVYMVLGIWWLAVLEFAAHFVIDYMKCRGELTYSQDQYAHLLCKVVWVALAIVTVQV